MYIIGVCVVSLLIPEPAEATGLMYPCVVIALRDLMESEVGLEDTAPTAAALDEEDDPPVPPSIVFF